MGDDRRIQVVIADPRAAEGAGKRGKARREDPPAPPPPVQEVVIAPVRTAPGVVHVAPHFRYHPIGAGDQRAHAPRVFELLRRHLEACRQDEGYHLVISEVEYVQAFLAAYSDERDFVRELIASGRLEVTGRYTRAHAICVQGESLIRNLVYGRLYAEGLLNSASTVLLCPDAFEVYRQLPQIAAGAGFEAIVSPGDGGAISFAAAPDGTEALGTRVDTTFRPDTLATFLRSIAKIDGGARQVVQGGLRLLDCDMRPPADWLIGHAGDFAARNHAISTPGRYVAETKRQVREMSGSIPRTMMDSEVREVGTLVSRADLKIANRLAENRLLNAEKWATLAAMVGARYPGAALDKAWRQVLSAQHAEAISGTSSEIAYIDLMGRYREALELAAEVEERSLTYAARLIGTRESREGVALVVFNPMGWQRTDVCYARVELSGDFASGFKLLDDRGKEVPTQLVAGPRGGDDGWADFAFIARDVPSIGYRTYHLAPAAQLPPEGTASIDDMIEDEHFRIAADRALGGGLVSIYDKTAKRELVNAEVGPANEVIALPERPDRERSAWELSPTGEVEAATERPAEMAALHGPVLSQFLISSELPDRCQLLQEVTLYHGLRRIDLRTTVEGYTGEHEILALRFPLAVSGQVTFEDRLAVVARRQDEAALEATAGLGRIEAAQNWLDIGPGAAVTIVEGGRRVGSAPLGVRALIVVSRYDDMGAVRPLLRALASRGITCATRLDAEAPEAELAEWDFCFSLGRTNALSRRALEHAPEVGGRLDEVLKKSEWVTALTLSGTTPVLIADTASAEGLPKLADLLGAAIESDRLEVPAAFDLSGVRRDEAKGKRKDGEHEGYGVALINGGTPAVGVDGDGTLVAPLFHTAAWGALPWGSGKVSGFGVPEHRSHVFEHALLPHKGQWRDADLVRAGYEFNNPLRAVITAASATSEGRPLPGKFSFVSVDAPSVVITAVKPVGNPLAAHVIGKSAPGKGLLVRMYEAEGRSVKAQVSFGFEPEEAWLADLMECRACEAELERGGWQLTGLLKRRSAGSSSAAPVEIPAAGIVTLGARLTQPVGIGKPEELGRTAESGGAIHCRYWEHNAGAAPMGNQPVTLWLRGPVPLGQNTRFTLGLSNDYRDREISGRVRITAPEEWPLIPKEVPYRIVPGSQAVYEVMVVVPPEATPCFLRAVTDDNGTKIQDVLPVGEIAPLVVSVSEDEEAIVVTLRNPNGDFVEGQVQLVTPLESWGRLAEGFALASVSPGSQAFRLEAGQEQRFPFVARGEVAWAVAKVAWYGRVQYAALRAG